MTTESDQEISELQSNSGSKDKIFEDFEDWEPDPDIDRVDIGEDEDPGDFLTGQDITGFFADALEPYIIDKKRYEKFRKTYVHLGGTLLNSLGVEEIIGSGADLKGMPKPVRILLIFAIIGIPPALVYKLDKNERLEDESEDDQE